MAINASKLRENIYKVLDRVLQTGIPIEISRHGKILKIVPPPGSRKLSNIKKHDVIKGNPESIVHMDWYEEWNQ